ncbi:Probable membrane-associated kinase regulator 2 [Linum grandiflorum]
MEAFTLLKYWRGGGSSSSAAGATSSIPIPPPPPPAHTTTTVYHDNAADTDNEEDAAGGDDGSFFDLEFSVGDDVANDCQEDCTDGGDGEFDFTLSSSSCSASSSNDAADVTTAAIALSPSSDEMFSQLVPMMDSSDAFNAKSQQQRIPVSLLKSATKFRVFLLGFKKSKANNENPVAQDENKIVSQVRSTDSAGDAAAAAEESEDDESGKQSKLFTVKFKVEEVPIGSLFTRDNSSSSSSKSSSSKDNANNPSSPSAAAAASDERQRFSKEALQKYLKKVKPLYVRVSKRYGEKMRFSSSGQLTLASSAAVNKSGDDIHITPQQQQQNTPSLKSSPSISTEKIQPEAVAAEKSEVHQTTNTTKQVGAKQGNLQAGLRVVCKHLGKSRSASSAAVAAAPSPTTSSQRRDDSLLQQQDGIQSAILHCKRSFNASRDSESSRSEEKSTESSASSGGEDGETSSG